MDSLAPSSYDVGREAVMSERTKQQIRDLEDEEYERLKKEDEYDDSPWTKEELQALAWEAGKSLGWEDMDDYDALYGS
jgi:hypothetical protein